LYNKETTTIQTIMRQWILKFGAPAYIHVDRGKVFESRSFAEFTKSMIIKLQFSSTYHHNANGIIERQFRTIRDALNASLKDNGRKNWVEILPEIEFSINASRQSTTKFSPSEIIFGKRIILDGSRRYDLDNKKNIEEVQQRENKMSQTCEQKRDFKQGDMVLMKVESRLKGTDRFEGPYRITRKIHNRSVEFENKTGRLICRNIEWLKRFKEWGCEDN